jgi:hypothetical protein
MGMNYAMCSIGRSERVLRGLGTLTRRLYSSLFFGLLGYLRVLFIVEQWKELKSDMNAGQEEIKNSICVG